MKAKIKTNDNVKVLTGRDRGKTGKVIQVLTNKKTSQKFVVVEKLNMRKKHLKARSRTDKGQIIELPAPIHMSNVAKIAKKKQTEKKTAPKSIPSTAKKVKTTDKK